MEVITTTKEGIVLSNTEGRTVTLKQYEKDIFNLIEVIDGEKQRICITKDELLIALEEIKKRNKIDANRNMDIHILVL